MLCMDFESEIKIYYIIIIIITCGAARRFDHQVSLVPDLSSDYYGADEEQGGSSRTSKRWKYSSSSSVA